MAEEKPEETKELSIGLHILGISLTLLRVTDPMPEKLEDAMLELTFKPNQPSSSEVRSFPLKDKFALSMAEIEQLGYLFHQVISVREDIEQILSKFSV